MEKNSRINQSFAGFDYNRLLDPEVLRRINAYACPRPQPEKHVEAATVGTILGCLAGYASSVGVTPHDLFYSQGVVWPEIIGLFLSLPAWWRPTRQSRFTRFLCALFTQFPLTLAIIFFAYQGHMAHPRKFSEDEAALLFITLFFLSIPAIIFSPFSCAIGRWLLAQMRK